MTIAVTLPRITDCRVLIGRVGPQLATVILIWQLVLALGGSPAGAGLAEAESNVSRVAAGADAELVVAEAVARWYRGPEPAAGIPAPFGDTP